MKPGRAAALCAALLAAAPRTAHACAICFGGLDNKSGLAAGFWWAIMLLLAVTLSLVGGICWAVWSVEKRRAAPGALAAAAPSGPSA